MIFIHKSAAMILSLAVMAAACPLTAVSAEETPSGLHSAQSTEKGRQLAKLAKDSKLFTISDGVSEEDKDLPLPSSFDLRKEGLVTEVKDQSPYGTCWAFSALNSVETSLIAREPDIDLSEWHLAYYTYSNIFGYPYQTEDVFDEGSFGINQEGGMLLGGIGPVYESDCPYQDESIRDSQKTLEDVYEEAKFRVTDMYTYPVWVDDDESEITIAQRNAVKRAILKGQALDASYSDADPCYNEETHAYFYDVNIMDPEEESAGHAISIVGWDDHFPASSFNSDPGKDGAWLVKNSWGVNWGDGGYFWISYQDPFLSDFTVFQASPAEADVHVYQHDTYGVSGSYAIGEYGDTSAMAANVFTAENDSFIESVMLCNTSIDSQWKITVYTDLKDPSDPTSGTAHSPADITLGQIGYRTVALPEAVEVQKGERFSIVAQISNQEQGFLIPCESATNSVWYEPDGSENSSDSSVTIDMIKRDFNEGESFYSTDGKEWHDIYLDGEIVSEYDDENGSFAVYTELYGNICMKAVARDSCTVKFSDYHKYIAPGTELTLSTHTDSDIYYAIDDGEFQLYTKPIPVNQEMTVTAYAQTEVPIICSQHYEMAKAAISSLLFKEDSDYWYAFRDEMYPDTFRYYASEESKSLQIMPIAAGTVTMNGTELPSGVLTDIPYTGKPMKLTLQVSQGGLPDTKYTLLINDPDESFTAGDVNLDGTTNASDAAQILIYAAQVGAGQSPKLPDENWFSRADYNEDGEVSATDAALVLIYAAKQGAGTE